MKKYTLLAVCFLAGLAANATESVFGLHDRVRRTQNSGIEFIPLNLFTDAGVAGNADIEHYRLYQPLKGNILSVYTAGPQAITLDLYDAEGKLYALQLVRSQPTSTDARIGYIDETGKHETPYATGLHYSGIVNGLKKSLAAISIFNDGSFMLFFSCDDGNFVMGKMKDGSDKYILYNTRYRKEELPVNCLVKDNGGTPVGTRAGAKGTGDIECKKLRIYWEVGYDIFQALGGLAATQNYLMGVFNFMQSIYYNDGMAIELSSMYIWSVVDPYTRSHPSDALFHFQRYWQSHSYTFYGDQAHLIIDGNGWLGYGYTTGLCQNAAFAVSNIIGAQQGNYPVWDVDIYLVAHETGHTIGAQHSHWCGWMTGPGGTCGAIDNCTHLENWGVPGCTNCNALYDANAPGFKGTIMSYCGGKLDFSEGFGSIISSYLRNRINSASCLRSVINPELAVQNICNNDGMITLNYKANNYGVAPYTYTWSGGQQTKDISGLTTPGKYYVSITDSNNCAYTDTAVLEYYGKPGDGIVLPGVMPYCCKDTSFTVAINATLPVQLSSCQTVAWLRTPQAVNSYSDLKMAYTNAAQSDLLLSDNDTLIDNNTAAILTIPSPPTCNSVTEYYYTPFVVRKPLPQRIYSTNATGLPPVKNGNINLGAAMSLPAEPNLPDMCAGTWQHITDTITVTISNYTGRANKLAIMITGADKSLLHLKTDYPGNGIYLIPIIGVDDHFQQMSVKAYDFNCSTATNCVTSSLTMQATRAVTYDALPVLTLDSGCVVGASVYLSFGPDNCNVAITDIRHGVGNISLIPNPAHETVLLKYNALAAGSGYVRISDILGKAVTARPIVYKPGVNSELFNLAGIAKGMYFVSLEVSGFQQNLKLLVQ